MIGFVTPGFRSAPTERQASVGCETYLQTSPTLVPHRPNRRYGPVPDCPSWPHRAIPDPALHPQLDVAETVFQQGNRPPQSTEPCSSRQGRSCAVTGTWSRHTSPRDRPPGPPGRLRAARRPRRRTGPRRHRPPRRASHGRKSPSGHDEPPRRRRRRVTQRAAAPAEEARQRLDSVTAVAFPACPLSCDNGIGRRSPKAAFRAETALPFSRTRWLAKEYRNWTLAPKSLKINGLMRVCCRLRVSVPARRRGGNFHGISM